MGGLAGGADPTPSGPAEPEAPRSNLAVRAAISTTLIAAVVATVWFVHPQAAPVGGRRSSNEFVETAYPWISDAGLPMALFQLAESSKLPHVPDDVTHVATIGHNGVQFGSTRSWNVKTPPSLRHESAVQSLNADELMSQVSQTEDGAHSTFMVCNQHHDVSHLSAMQLVGIEPVVTRIPGLNADNSVVHHMNLYLCTSEEAAHSKIGRCEDGKQVMPDSMAKPCYRMVYAYDRDARPFYFPPDVGVRLGKGSPYTRLVQEWHYLLPKKGIHKKFTDFTHFKLLLTNRPRQHNAAILGMMNMSMTLPPGETAYRHSFLCPAANMQRMLARDLKKFGAVKPFAVHLHSHKRGKKLWWDHLRDGKKIGEYGRLNKYEGYGRHESFMHLQNELNSPKLQREFDPGTAAGASVPSIQSGDALRINCVFDTSKEKETIEYGTNHGEEMCGHLMMYYPHDWQHVKDHESTCITEKLKHYEMPA